MLTVRPARWINGSLQSDGIVPIFQIVLASHLECSGGRNNLDRAIYVEEPALGIVDYLSAIYHHVFDYLILF